MQMVRVINNNNINIIIIIISSCRLLRLERWLKSSATDRDITRIMS